MAQLTHRHRLTLDFLKQKTEQQKRHTNAAIDQAMMQGEVELQAKFGEQMMMLSQAAGQRKFELETQARTLAMEYSMRKVHEDLLAQDYEVHRRYFEASFTDSLPAPEESYCAHVEEHVGAGGVHEAGEPALPATTDFGAVAFATDGGGVAADADAPPTFRGPSDPTLAAAPESPPAASTQARKAVVVVLSASNLTNKDSGLFGDVSDPFVVIRLDGKEHKTPTVNNNLHPRWDQGNKFALKVTRMDAPLEFEVFNANTVLANDSLGTAKVDLRDLPLGRRVRKKEKLAGGGNGMLEFDVSLETAPDRKQSPSRQSRAR